MQTPRLKVFNNSFHGRLVGLDFSPHIVRNKDIPEEQQRDIQKQIFRRQIELAIKADLPLNVHSR